MDWLFEYMGKIDYFKIWEWVYNNTDVGLLIIIVFILLIIVKDKLAASLQGKKYEALLQKGLELLSERMKDNVKDKQATDEEKAKVEETWNELKEAEKKDKDKVDPNKE